MRLNLTDSSFSVSWFFDQWTVAGNIYQKASLALLEAERVLASFIISVYGFLQSG